MLKNLTKNKMKEILENQKTEAKISVETIIGDEGVTYVVKSKKGSFTVNCEGDGFLKVTSDNKTMQKAVGGRGENDDKTAWFTSEHCTTESAAVSNVLELLITISK